MSNISVRQAVEQLKKAEIISNEEVFRRWLREGKVAGACIESKRQGWRIPEETIAAIIATHKETSSNKEYDRGYKDGYVAAKQDFKLKMKKFIFQGAYDERFSLHRVEFQEMAKISRHRKRDFFRFADERIFKRGVKNPRSNIQVEYLEGWFAFGSGYLILFGPDYDYDRDLTIQHQAIALLNEYLRQEFIATNK